MSMLTVLRPETLEKLQGLIALNIDSARVCRQSAARVQNLVIMQMLRVAAGVRERFAEQLQQIVGAGGGEPITSGTVAGALHRTWEALLGAVGNEQDRGILEAVQHAEENLAEHYQHVMQEPIDELTADVLRRHLEGVQKFEYRIRGVLAEMRSAARPN